MGMVLVERIKGKSTKQERIDEAIDQAAPFVEALEMTFGKDLLKQEEIKPLVVDYITAAKTLVNGIDRFKNLRVKPEPEAPATADKTFPNPNK